MVDHELAMLCAAGKKPDVLVLMMTFEDFVLSREQHTLDYTGMDLDIMAGNPAFWRKLSRASLKLNLTLDGFLKRFLKRSSYLVRSRIHALDIVSSLLANDRQFIFLFGHEREKEAFFTPMPAKGFPHLLEERAKGNMAITPREVKAKMRGLPFFLRLLPDYINDLNSGLAAGKTTVIWCWNPVVTDFLKADQRRHFLSFCRKADNMLMAAGIVPYDLKDLVPVEHFFTYSHVDKEGHTIIADRLEPLITNALQ